MLQAIEEENPSSMKKSYFLYSNNTVKEVAKNDLHVLLGYVSDKIRDKV